MHIKAAYLLLRGLQFAPVSLEVVGYLFAPERLQEGTEISPSFLPSVDNIGSLGASAGRHWVAPWAHKCCDG